MSTSNTIPSSTFAADTGRGPSISIWERCPILEILEDPGKGYGFFDDFIRGDITGTLGTVKDVNQYAMFGSSGATATYDDVAGGAIVLTEATDNESVSMTTEQHPFSITANAGELWYEARIKHSTITTNETSFFVGLMDTIPLIVGVPLSITGTLVDTANLVGFHFPEANTTAFDTTYKANTVTAVEVNSDVGALVVDTYVKLGMHFQPNDIGNGANELVFFIDGVPQAATKTIPDNTGTDFPADARMGPTIAMMMGNSAAETISMDWWRCYQLI